MPDPVATHCPYCGEPIELLVDTSAGAASYVEDCPVCCQPMQVQVSIDDGGPSVRVRTDDE